MDILHTLRILILMLSEGSGKKCVKCPLRCPSGGTVCGKMPLRMALQWTKQTKVDKTR